MSAEVLAPDQERKFREVVENLRRAVQEGGCPCVLIVGVIVGDGFLYGSLVPPDLPACDRTPAIRTLALTALDLEKPDPAH